MTGSGNGKGAGNRKNVIDQGTTFKGVLTASSTVVVLGVLEGEVSGEAVEVEESGIVRGKAKLKELRSRGELAGEFEADEVELGGRVHDQTVIRARSLLVGQPGRAGGSDAVFGECQIDVGEVPTKEQAIAAVLAANRPPQTEAIPIAQARAQAAAPPVVAEAANPGADDPTVIVAPVIDQAAEAPAAEGDASHAGGRRGKRAHSERPAEGG